MTYPIEDTSTGEKSPGYRVKNDGKDIRVNPAFPVGLT